MNLDRPSKTIWSDETPLDLPANDAVRVEKSGIVFSDGLSLEAWEIVGRRLMSLTDSASWWIADWLVYGESQFKDRYGEAAKRTSLNYQTLRNYTWVARRFDMSRRRDALSFGHHAEVAALDPPEQEFWLRKAEEHGWSRNELRNNVRASQRERLNGHDQDTNHREGPHLQNEPPAGEATGGRATADSLLLRLTSDQLAQCEAAANKVALSIDEWATKVLLEAAKTPSAKDARGRRA